MKKYALSLMLFYLSGCIFSTYAVDRNAPDFPWFNPALSFDQRIDLIMDELTIAEKISLLMNESPAIERLGIPEYNWWNEALHGVARTGNATVFPQPIGLGATFDEDLIYRIYDAVSDEARAKYEAAIKLGNRGRFSGLTFWSPNVNIFRDPRWGRGMETFGEDPFLTSRLGSACVKGLQGEHPIYLKTSACAKHYAVHSGPEALRHEFDVGPSKKDLYETYLPAFKELVTNAHVESVMGAYNRVYGEPACASKLLLEDILLEEWGFEGHLVSDCGALRDFYTDHNVVTTAAEAAALALNRGIDLNCGKTYEALAKALDSGLITEATIDERLHDLFLTRFKLGFFDPPSENPYTKVDVSVISSEKHVKLAYEAALKSVVLLKNDGGILPLNQKTPEIFVCGPHATNNEVLLGNYNGWNENLVSIMEGLVSRADPGTALNYRQGVLDYRDNINPIDYVAYQARRAEVTIAVMGLSGLIEGEQGESLASPTKGDRYDLGLPQNQLDYLRKIKAGRDKNKPLILILTGGSPIILPEVAELADVILWVWYPGQEGGNAVADVIFGNAVPSGRLPLTFPASADQLPEYEDYSMANRTYRYSTTRPQYPFGYGLSFTRFSYSDIQVSDSKISDDGTLEVSVKVVNTGDFDGEEVVQLYVTYPDENGDQPLWSLKGFKRIALERGDSEKLSFKLGPEELQQFAQDGSASVKPGTYTLHVGGSSPGARSEALGIKIQSLDFVVN